MAKILSSRHKKKLAVSIHSSAYPAYSFFQKQACLFSKSALDLNVISTLNTGLTLHAISTTGNQIELISGFEVLSFSLAKLALNDYVVILYSRDELTEIEITHRAWYGVLRSLLSSLDSHHLEKFRRELNHSAPQELLLSLFKQKQVSQASLAKRTSMSRSALAQQNSKTVPRPDQQVRNERSIFDTLLQGRTPNDRADS